MTDSDRETPARRDWQGRYPTGRSGNPAGRPRGALNRATRIAAELLDGEAEALWRAEIDLALAGDRVLLRHCNDRIIAPQRAQPVAFTMPRIEDAADLAAAMGALLGAAARDLITPAEAESLARSCEASARTIEIGERIGRERLAAEQEAVERRFARSGPPLCCSTASARSTRRPAGSIAASESSLSRSCASARRRSPRSPRSRTRPNWSRPTAAFSPPTRRGSTERHRRSARPWVGRG
jgi:uncharacterized protein DUF5681